MNQNKTYTSIVDKVCFSFCCSYNSRYQIYFIFKKNIDYDKDI